MRFGINRTTRLSEAAQLPATVGRRCERGAGIDYLRSRPSKKPKKAARTKAVVGWSFT